MRTPTNLTLITAFKSHKPHQLAEQKMVVTATTTTTPQQQAASTTAATSSPMTMTTTTPMTTTKKKPMPYQKDMRMGWIIMIAYWMIGEVVGRHFGYYTRLLQPQSLSRYHALATLVTLISRAGLNSRYGPMGRQRDIPAILLYGVANGILETFLFLAVYDVGRHAVENAALGCLLGFSLYYVYAAVIHIFMWQPHIFPQHCLEGVPSFFTHGLPFLTAKSMGWLLLYEQTNDVFFVCLLHIFTDLGHGWKSAIPYTTFDSQGQYYIKNNSKVEKQKR